MRVNSDLLKHFEFWLKCLMARETSYIVSVSFISKSEVRSSISERGGIFVVGSNWKNLCSKCCLWYNISIKRKEKCFIPFFAFITFFSLKNASSHTSYQLILKRIERCYNVKYGELIFNHISILILWVAFYALGRQGVSDRWF